MNIRILDIDGALQLLDEADIELERARERRAPAHVIRYAESQKAIWRRILHHIKRGEMVTFDDENRRVKWHHNAASA